jgi:hypothetical protein
MAEVLFCFVLFRFVEQSSVQCNANPLDFDGKQTNKVPAKIVVLVEIIYLILENFIQNG